MKEYSATATINASPETIWDILTDAEGYPAWDTGIIRLEGDIVLGKKITAYTKLNPDRAFPIKVMNFIAPKHMMWGSKMPLGLFKAERTFKLNKQSDEVTELVVREQFSGLLLPLIGRTIPNLTPVFEQFVADLKRHAESLT